MDPKFMQVFLDPMDEIDTNLYLGSLIAANNFSLLSGQGISSIVCALTEGSQFTKHAFIRYHYIMIDDVPSANIVQHLPDALKFISTELKQGKKVLIHCAAGISRSASVALGYFMAKYNLDYDSALRKIRKSRGCAFPNQGFEAQLRRVDKRFLGQYLS